MICFIFQSESPKRYHAVKFNENLDDFVINKVCNTEVYFSIESLRLAFTRINSDQFLCIVTLNNEGALSVRLMANDRLFLTESLILCKEKEEANDYNA